MMYITMILLAISVIGWGGSIYMNYTSDCFNGGKDL